MLHETILAVVVAFSVTALLTGKVRSLAMSQGLLDVPNRRSSHELPTPRGGGLAIAITTLLSAAGLAALGVVSMELFIALGAGGLMIAAIGYIDDRKHVPAGVRLAVHFAAAFWAMAWLGYTPLQLSEQSLFAHTVSFLLGSLGVVWALNLFNFMDGIDGIATCEAIFVACGGAILALLSGTSLSVPALALVVGGAAAGFLVWNWPPAKIFMGDVGSGYLGFALVVLGLAAASESAVMLPAWLILGGAFIVDATVTLTRRVLRGERPQLAHRTHAYQWLARRWNSHRRVTAVFAAVNLFWLFPCGLAATVYERSAWWILMLAAAPLVAAALLAGAGRAERPVPADPAA